MSFIQGCAPSGVGGTVVPDEGTDPQLALDPNMIHGKKALVILSGGQDSTTCLFDTVAQLGKLNVRAVTYDYGQRHIRELEAARKVADLAGILSHDIIHVGPLLKGRSPLTDHQAPLEQYRDAKQMAGVIGDRVELTFVPMRNALFLTLAANYAVCHDIYDLVTGVCQEDNANYPDCRERFIREQERTINYALGLEQSETAVVIHTPLMRMTKAQSVRFAVDIPNAFRALAYSHTAYDGAYPPTGKDHATLLRADGFEKADVPDPLVLRAVREGLMDMPQTDNYRALAISQVIDHLTPAEYPANWA